VYGVNCEAEKEMVKDCRVELVKRATGDGVDRKVAGQIRNLKLKQIGFDALDASISLNIENSLKGVKLRAQSQLVWNLRKVKDKTELSHMRKAAEITNIGIRRAAEVIESGIREYEVAAEMEYAMRKLGSDGVAFETIVASGPSSAFPHGGCTDKKIKNGEFIVIDLGAKYQHYCADLTRTFLVGEPSQKQAKIYETVREAQQKAFESLREGVKTKDADVVAREIIRHAGYGKYFVHSLGHGIGLDVHELPTLTSEGKDLLKAGNVVTDEPGIYIVGFGGVRIEDTVLIHKEKAERLTKAAYNLQL
ncbi:aminopeptidase P family protein, partial [Candidatus Bathyarchaeota archaeon]|nr:aminopeptidase P family protein [Candidatus Bathyarchaeota archaeon]